MTNLSAAAILRDARLRAALTQTELAEFAGVAQSVVSAYEAGRREPSFEMLRKLVAATGLELDATVVAARPRTPLGASVELHRVELRRTLGRLGARNVRLFGSVVRGEDGPGSDIDLLVDVPSSVGLFAIGRMRSEAERILGSRVDVVPANSLKSEIAEKVLREAVAL